MKISNNKKISFSSGLNPHLKQIIKNTSINRIEDGFLKQYGVDAKFDNNKIFASFFAFVLNIFEEISEKYKLPVSALPPRIRVFKRKILSDKTLSNSFCTTDSGKVLKNELPFELRSVFMKNVSNFFETDKKFDWSYSYNKRSSSHFLSQVIHEWCHNIHLDLIFKKYGYEGNCPFAINLYKSKNPKGLMIIKDFSEFKPDKYTQTQLFFTLGEYSATADSKMEIFAEGFTKLVTNALDEKTLKVAKNPLDGLKFFPRKIKTFIENQFL